ncbi:hypothetical protein TELCIR_00297 [Teladorsagia circumcincta]|uniref:WD domain, G-beta repeat protein n=1 Tax=Teladorsagia circumcincta TaxID=45464 RepID=A0A2G9V777_TELCI|nr:hypothetical protein TELCIR_00297 [Teladorsagia circumcincta]
MAPLRASHDLAHFIGWPCPVLAATTSVFSSKISSLTLNQAADVFASTSASDDFVKIGTTDCTDGSFGRKTAQLSCTKRPLCVLFMDDQRTKQSVVLIGSLSGINIVDAQNGVVFRRLTSKGGATSLFSWHGCMVAGGDARGGVALWDARVNEPVAYFSPVSTNPVVQRSVFSVDSSARVLALAGDSGYVHLFDIATRKEITKKKICPHDVKALRFSPRMRLLLAADTRSVHLVNLSDISFSPLPQPTCHVSSLKPVTGMLWDPQSCRFIARTMESRLRLYQPDDTDKEEMNAAS